MEGAGCSVKIRGDGLCEHLSLTWGFIHTLLFLLPRISLLCLVQTLLSVEEKPPTYAHATLNPEFSQNEQTWSFLRSFDQHPHSSAP